jgi:hypothetical protein
MQGCTHRLHSSKHPIIIPDNTVTNMEISEVRFDRRVVKSPDVLLQQIEGESVLLHMTLGEYYGLNVPGTAMWQALAESPSIQVAYDRLAAEFDVEPERLKSDLIRLIQDLTVQGLIQLADT